MEALYECSYRVNKNGKKEYKVRYYYYLDGKKVDSKTGWFSSEKEAQEEADRLTRIKELEDTYKVPG